MKIKELKLFYVTDGKSSYDNVKALSKKDAVYDCIKEAKKQLAQEKCTLVALRYERKREIKAFFWKKSSIAAWQKEIEKTEQTIKALNDFIKCKNFNVYKYK